MGRECAGGQRPLRWQRAGQVRGSGTGRAAKGLGRCGRVWERRRGAGVAGEKADAEELERLGGSGAAGGRRDAGTRSSAFVCLLAPAGLSFLARPIGSGLCQARPTWGWDGVT